MHHRALIIAAVTAALLVADFGRVAAESVVVFRVLASGCDTGDEFGNAFPAEITDGSGRRSVVLVSALHVVSGCRTIALSKDPCDSTVLDLTFTDRESRQVFEMPDLDLILIPLTDNDLGQLNISGRKLPSFASKPLKHTASSAVRFAYVPSMDDDNRCPAGHAILETVLSARKHFDYIAELENLPLANVGGSLIRAGSATTLITYFGTPSQGGSGAPVIVDDVVVGVHDGGFGSGVGWAVRVDEKTLAAKMVAPTQLGDWGEFSPPLKTNSLAGPDPTDRAVAWGFQRPMFNVSIGSYLGRTHGSDDNGMGFVARFGASSEEWTFPAVRRSFSLAVDAGVQGRIGSNAHEYLSPLGDVVEREDGGEMHVGLQAGFSLRMFRYGFLRPTLSLHGLAGWAKASGAVLDEANTIWTIGGGGRLRLACSATNAGCNARRCRSLFLVTGLDITRSPMPIHRYTGEGAATVALPTRWRNMYLLEVGFEY